VNKTRRLFILRGRTISPVVSSKPLFMQKGCRIRISGDETGERAARRVVVGKLRKGEHKAPVALSAYMGFITVTYLTASESQGRKKIAYFLQKDSFGIYSHEGFGRVKWLRYTVMEQGERTNESKITTRKRGFRKGLNPSCPKALQRLLLALLLHDFVHTERHHSKIYTEIAIADPEIRSACKNHHSMNSDRMNDLLPLVKYYDHFAASLSRKKALRTTTRYNYEKGPIDFERLAEEIEERQDSAYRLYHYIYHSKELARIVEAMEYGRTSLKYHLLLMANLAIEDFIKGKITLNGEKIRREKSTPAGEEAEEKLQTAKGAEMRRSSTLSNTDSREPDQLKYRESKEQR